METENSYSFEKECEIMAQDLKNKKRSWYLNEVDGDFIAAPLSPRNMNQMGGGAHLRTNVEQIKKLCDEGKVLNKDTVEKILSYCE